MGRLSTAFLTAAAAVLVLVAMAPGPGPGLAHVRAGAPTAATSVHPATAYADPPPGSGRRWS